MLLKRILPVAILALLFLGGLTAVSPTHSQPNQTPTTAVTLSGAQKKWHPLIIDFTGPYAQETDDAPNPFLDYRLQVNFTGPNGRVYNVPGFFAGDGQGNGSGNIWRVIFAPDAAGTWQYTASFRAGPDVAIDLNPHSGSAHSFDGLSGSVNIAYLTCDEPGFLRWGRLAYVGQHYLKFVDGGYWLKGGTDSPENFLAYIGIDNTVDQGGLHLNFLHLYPEHEADWQAGDPNFTSADTGYDAKGIIGALNYLAAQHVNSIYFLPMNLGGDGQEVYPFIGATETAYDKTHYDISKLHQWGIVLDHAQRKGVALQIVLAETESENEQWFDNGVLGVERKLYYREMVARFGHLLAIKWNISEENDFWVHQIQEFAAYIQALDWAQHPITVHTPLNDFSDYEPILGDGRFSATSIQYTTDLAGSHVEYWRGRSVQAGRPWVLDMDENAEALSHQNADDLRRKILYPVYFSGGNIEWYMGYYEQPIGGDLRLENFRTRETMWRYTWYARRFMVENLPFWQMIPQDHLLQIANATRGAGEVFAKPGEVYAVYMPIVGGQLNLTAVPGLFTMRWFNPHDGVFAGNTVTVAGGGWLDLNSPPSRPTGDWVVLLKQIPTTTFLRQGMAETFLPVINTAGCPAGPIP